MSDREKEPYRWRGKDGGSYTTKTATDKHLTYTNRLVRERITELSAKIDRLADPNSTSNGQYNSSIAAKLHLKRNELIPLAVHTGKEMRNRGLFKLPIRVEKFKKLTPSRHPLDPEENNPNTLGLFVPSLNERTEEEGGEVERLKKRVRELEQLMSNQQGDNKKHQRPQPHRRIIIEDD